MKIMLRFYFSLQFNSTYLFMQLLPSFIRTGKQLANNKLSKSTQTTDAIGRRFHEPRVHYFWSMEKLSFCGVRFINYQNALICWINDERQFSIFTKWSGKNPHDVACIKMNIFRWRKYFLSLWERRVDSEEKFEFL